MQHTEKELAAARKYIVETLYTQMEIAYQKGWTPTGLQQIHAHPEMVNWFKVLFDPNNLCISYGAETKESHITLYGFPVVPLYHLRKNHFTLMFLGGLHQTVHQGTFKVWNGSDDPGH